MREINLLPPVRRHALRRQAAEVALTTFLRTSAISLGGITAAGLVTIGALIVVTMTGGGATAQDIEQAVSQYKELRRTINNRNESLQYITTIEQERIVWSQHLSLLLASIPTNVTINDVRGQAQREANTITNATLTITGRASNRATLSLLEERLRQLPFAARLQSPPSNLLERLNSPYQFTIILEANQP